MYKKGYTAKAYNSILGHRLMSEITILSLTFQPNWKFSTHLKEKLCKADKINAYMSSDACEKKAVAK